MMERRAFLLTTTALAGAAAVGLMPRPATACGEACESGGYTTPLVAKRKYRRGRSTTALMDDLALLIGLFLLMDLLFKITRASLIPGTKELIATRAAMRSIPTPFTNMLVPPPVPSEQLDIPAPGEIPAPAPAELLRDAQVYRRVGQTAKKQAALLTASYRRENAGKPKAEVAKALAAAQRKAESVSRGPRNQAERIRSRIERNRKRLKEIRDRLDQLKRKLSRLEQEEDDILYNAERAWSDLGGRSFLDEHIFGNRKLPKKMREFYEDEIEYKNQLIKSVKEYGRRYRKLIEEMNKNLKEIIRLRKEMKRIGRQLKEDRRKLQRIASREIGRVKAKIVSDYKSGRLGKGRTPPRGFVVGLSVPF